MWRTVKSYREQFNNNGIWRKIEETRRIPLVNLYLRLDPPEEQQQQLIINKQTNRNINNK